MDECKDYGHRPTTPKEKCLNCNLEKIYNCELKETYDKEKITAHTNKEETKRAYMDQLQDMRADDSCFGAFNFDENECWKKCEFNLLCLHETGIKADEECPAFPPREDKSSENTCWKCVFIMKCKSIKAELDKAIANEKETSKIFKGFLSLAEMRETIQLEED